MQIKSVNLIKHNPNFASRCRVGQKCDNQYKDSQYLHYVYDRSNEIYQTKKWINDFKHNDGFKATCVVVDFKPEELIDKSPIDIIDAAGETLKSAKKIKSSTEEIQAPEIQAKKMFDY